MHPTPAIILWMDGSLDTSMEGGGGNLEASQNRRSSFGSFPIDFRKKKLVKNLLECIFFYFFKLGTSLKRSTRVTKKL